MSRSSLATTNELVELLPYLTPRERDELDRLLKVTTSNEVAWLPDDPVRWIEREFYVPETNAAIVLQPYQRAVLRRAFWRDSAGLLQYSLVLYSDLKKSAKSTIAAAVVLWLAWHHPWETCRVVGNDLKQADSRTFYYIRRAIELNPRLRERVGVRQDKLSLPNNTTIEAIAVDPKGEAGGGDLIVCFTELWAARSNAALQLWTETTLSPLKYGKSLRWYESYAGYTGESPILEQLYAAGVDGGARLDDDLELYDNAAVRLLVLWNTRPRCPWQTPAYYAQEAATLAPAEFARVHRNQWASAQSSFVPIEWWDGCQADVPPLLPYEAVVVGIDAAVSGDCFAIVAVSRRGDSVILRYANIWTPPAHGKIDFGAPDGPEAELRRLASTCNVVEFAYDPMQMEDMAMRLRKAGVGHFRAFAQGQDRLIADKALFDRIRDRRIAHAGNAMVRQHLMNADQKADGDGKLRIVKRAAEHKIDAAVALSMAAQRAAYLNISAG